MPVTYLEDFDSDRDRVRFALSDTIENKGPRPDGCNFTDAEIAYLLSSESSVVNAAIALGFETLRDEWAAFAVSEKEGDVSFDAKAVCDKFDKSAAFWRKKSDTQVKQAAKFRVHSVVSC